MSSQTEMVQKMASLGMAITGPDAEDLGYLIENLTSTGYASAILHNPQGAFTLATEALRYAYSLGNRRGKASSIRFLVADE